MKPQTNRSLALLRLAALSATLDGALDDETLLVMRDEVIDGALSGLDPAQAWLEVATGLMLDVPSNMMRALHASGALEEILPEVASVFGVPQIADDPPQVDIGQHMLRMLDEAARCKAPLPIRFAALVMHAGKSDSPPEHLPVHYRHEERGIPRVMGIATRFRVPDDCLDMAMLATTECERVHRATASRAGPLAALLSSLDAFDNPGRFGQFLKLCECDFRAHIGKQDLEYPKAALLEAALSACAGIDKRSFASAAELHEVRAAVIAQALCSKRWSG